MKKIYLFCVTVAVVLFYSCDYKFHDSNFVDLKPPASDHRIDLNIQSGTDTILIYEPTELNYNVSTFGLNVIGAKFEVGDKSWTQNSASGWFNIYPTQFASGIYELKMTVYTNSGSGSIADHFGAEGYVAQRKWIIIIDNEVPTPIEVTKSVTPEGYLKYSWQKPKRYRFYSYQISCGSKYSNYMSSTTDINKNYFIDSLYFGGEGHCSVNLILKNDEWITGKQLSFTEPFPIPKFEEIGLDSVRLHWSPSKYNLRYTVKTTSEKVLYDAINDTCYTFPHPGIAERLEYIFFAGSAKSASLIYSNAQSTYVNYVLGNWWLSNYPITAYNQVDKIVYSNEYSQILAFDIKTMNQVSSFFLKDLSFGSNYACPTNSTKIAVYCWGYINILQDKNLTNPFKIPVNVTPDYMCFTDNDRIGIAGHYKFEVYDAISGLLLTSVPITDYPTTAPWAGFSMSQDAKYICAVTKNGFRMYSAINGIQLYEKTNPYISVMFDPYNPSRFFVSPSNSKYIEIRNALDFSLIETIPMPDTSNLIQNIDPETGYLMITNYKKIYLYDLKKSKFVFSIKTSDLNENPKIYNNTIFCSNGYYLDITKYIKP